MNKLNITEVKNVMHSLYILNLSDNQVATTISMLLSILSLSNTEELPLDLFIGTSHPKDFWIAWDAFSCV